MHGASFNRLKMKDSASAMTIFPQPEPVEGRTIVMQREP